MNLKIKLEVTKVQVKVDGDYINVIVPIEQPSRDSKLGIPNSRIICRVCLNEAEYALRDLEGAIAVARRNRK